MKKLLLLPVALFVFFAKYMYRPIMALFFSFAFIILLVNLAEDNNKYQFKDISKDVYDGIIWVLFGPFMYLLYFFKTGEVGPSKYREVK